MSYLIFITGIACFIGAAAVALVSYYKQKRTMQKLQQMLDAAIEGSFLEKSFDETLLSAVESRMAEYLGVMETLARENKKEKDTIKELIADIAHQTKTPIANILLYTELLKEEEQWEEGRRSIALLESQAQKLSFLIASLIKLSRLETGVMELHPKKAPIEDLMEDVKAQYAPKAEEKGLYFRVDSKQGQGKSVLYDRKWTSEALGNIIDNAIKYTREGGITITVYAYEFFMRIAVADTGIGISREEQTKIFGRFYRSARVSEQEGVGIGLYLARQILLQEGGYIKVVSGEGKGSEFSVYLPAA